MELEEYFELIGQNVTKIREYKKISIEELSKLSGIRVEYLSKIENAQAKGMLQSHLEFISKALKTELSELLKDN